MYLITPEGSSKAICSENRKQVPKEICGSNLYPVCIQEVGQASGCNVVCHVELWISSGFIIPSFVLVALF